MKKAFHIAKANIRKQKSATASLFVIIMLMSALCTIGLSVVLGVTKEYEASIERLNGLHSVFVMTKDKYLQSYEEIIRNDAHVTEYEIGDVIFVGRLPINYGGDFEHQVMILNADTPWKISAPNITGDDASIPRESSVYLPEFSRNLGFDVGGAFTLTYRNKPIILNVAGFFEASEYSMPNGAALKFYVPGECFEELKRQMGSSVWIAIRFDDPYYSTTFNENFQSQIDVDVGFFDSDSFVMDFSGTADNAITPIMILTSIILIFALVILLISLLVTRFRVTNSIEDSMYNIGVQKASGYTSRQIIASFLMEYSLIALPAAITGILLAIPPFSVIRRTIEGFSGVRLAMGINVSAGVAASLLFVAMLLLMVLRPCRRIRELTPIDALRGGLVSNGNRRNFFPLHKGVGNVQTRLGLKSMTAYYKRYVMIGVILAATTFALIIVAAMYQNFVMDTKALIRMTGIEIADVDLTVARRADADALAVELESLPQVRKTSMLDWSAFKVDGVNVMGFVSSDYEQMETMSAFSGRFPKYDNEIALPKIHAERLGKELGDSVKVKINGITQEYIICGYFSTANNGGQMGTISLEGYRRHDPNYRRKNVKVYLNEGVTFSDFEELLKTKYGVVNVYLRDENERYAAAKARAEEKISNYLDFYGIDSVEYAVIYNGDIIMKGSSDAYQIEKITDFKAWANTQISVYADIVKLLTQAFSVISMAIISLILAMTVRQIIIKRRREMGILKSCGYTTKQLARQLGISFLPCAISGVTLGCVGGAFSVNPAITAMFASTGVYNANVFIHPLAAAVIGVASLLFVFAVISISAMRIRRVTVYELTTE